MDLNFAFGFFLDAFGRFDDKRYFTYTVESQVISRNPNFKKEKFSIPFDYCSKYPGRFVSNRYNYTNETIANEVNGLYCLTFNNSTMEGAYLLNYFENIKIQVLRCVNSTKRAEKGSTLIK